MLIKKPFPHLFPFSFHQILRISPILFFSACLPQAPIESNSGKVPVTGLDTGSSTSILTSDSFDGADGDPLGAVTDAANGGTSMSYSFMGESIELLNNRATAPAAIDGDHAAIAIIDAGSDSCDMSLTLSVIGAFSGLVFRAGDDHSFFFVPDPNDDMSCGSPGYRTWDSVTEESECLGGNAPQNGDVLTVEQSASLIDLKVNGSSVGTILPADAGEGTSYALVFMSPTAESDNLVIQNCN